MPTYKVDLSQTVTETTTLYVQAHSEEQAELIALYIAENGKDPWDRSFVGVDFITGDIADGPTVRKSTEATGAVPCNKMPEHTEGLFKAETF